MSFSSCSGLSLNNIQDLDHDCNCIETNMAESQTDCHLSHFFLIKTLSPPDWERKTWYEVQRDQWGEVLGSEFSRVVKSLKMEFAVQVLSPVLINRPGPHRLQILTLYPYQPEAETYSRIIFLKVREEDGKNVQSAKQLTQFILVDLVTFLKTLQVHTHIISCSLPSVVIRRFY